MIAAYILITWLLYIGVLPYNQPWYIIYLPIIVSIGVDGALFGASLLVELFRLIRGRRWRR